MAGNGQGAASYARPNSDIGVCAPDPNLPLLTIRDRGLYDTLKELGALVTTGKVNEENGRFSTLVNTVLSLMDTIPGETDNVRKTVAFYILMQQTAQYQEYLAQQPKEVTLQGRLGAALHDIGKLGYTQPIQRNDALYQNGKNPLRDHPKFGAEFLVNEFGFPEDSLVVRIVRCHHENYDGSGYPEGISTKDLPVEVRILSVADSVVAGVVRNRKTVDQILQELHNKAGTAYDPEAATAAIGVLTNKKLESSVRGLLNLPEGYFLPIRQSPAPMPPAEPVPAEPLTELSPVEAPPAQLTPSEPPTQLTPVEAPPVAPAPVEQPPLPTAPPPAK